MSTTYPKELLENQDEQFQAEISPEDAIKVVRQVRKVAFFIRLNMELITENKEETYKYFPHSDNLSVSAKQAIDALTSMADTAKRLKERRELTGTVRITRLGSCLFIG